MTSISDPASVLRQIARERECERGGCPCHRTTQRGEGLTHCPAHDDTHPSLSAALGRSGRVVVRCWAGCKQPAVIAALRARGLWPAGKREKWRVGGISAGEGCESVKSGPTPARREGLSPDFVFGLAPTGAGDAPGGDFTLPRPDVKPGPTPGGDFTLPRPDVKPGPTPRGEGLSPDFVFGSAPTPPPEGAPAQAISHFHTLHRRIYPHPTLTLADLAAAKRLPEEFLAQLGARDVRLHGRPAVAIPYLDEDGTELGLRYRLSLAGDQRFRWPKGARAELYGRQRLGSARRAGWALILEGESDCWTAWYHGLPALGVPGKACWRSEWRSALAGIEAYVWQEPDAADFAAAIGRDVPTAKVIVAPPATKDLSEAHIAGEDLPALVARLRAAATPIAERRAAKPAADLSALEVAAAPVVRVGPISAVKAELQRLGYGGDPTAALVTYLCLTTRLLAMRRGAMPAHLLLLGPPAAGKSYTLQTVLGLFPSDAYHEIDAGSPRVLIYDTADLQHRALLFAELDSLPAGEDNPAASAVRNLLQDHRLHYQVTVRHPETGEFTVRDIDRPGPTVLVTTAVREPGGQLGSRLFALAVREDAAQIQAALDAQASLFMDGATAPSPALIALQASLQHRAPWHVQVPFVRQLAKKIKSVHAARIQRDFPRLVSLVMAAAILNEHHREREGGRLVATIDDYATVYRLVGPMYSASITGATAQVRRVVEAVRALHAEGVKRVTFTAVGQRVELHPEQARRLAQVALRHEWLVNLAERPHQAAHLDVGEDMPATVGLPAPEELVPDQSGASAAGGDAPLQPCFACGGRRWWRRSGGGAWNCKTCHPPPAAALVESEVELAAAGPPRAGDEASAEEDDWEKILYL